MKIKEEIIMDIIGGDLTSSLHFDISECMTVYADRQTASLRQENERLKVELEQYKASQEILASGYAKALNYIEECPCDPDITMKQNEAWWELQDFKKSNPDL